MFERLFGNTPEEQKKFLQLRVWITTPMIVIGLICGNMLAALAAYVWAWSFMRNWFGFTTLGAIFSGSVLIGILMILLYLTLGYFIGLVIFVLGFIRYIYLVFAVRN